MCSFDIYLEVGGLSSASQVREIKGEQSERAVHLGFTSRAAVPGARDGVVTAAPGMTGPGESAGMRGHSRAVPGRAPGSWFSVGGSRLQLRPPCPRRAGARPGSGRHRRSPGCRGSFCGQTPAGECGDSRPPWQRPRVPATAALDTARSRWRRSGASR